MSIVPRSRKAKKSTNSALRAIEQYEHKYRVSQPISHRPQPFHVEDIFDSFVANFGGKKISELIENKAQMPLNADYLFEEQNVIAELKTLEGIYSGPNAIKKMTQAYIDSGCTGSDVMGVIWRGEQVPEAAAALIKKRVRRSIEQRIKKARKQLKKSKIAIGNHTTRSLILFAMDQNPLLGHKTMLFNLAKIMGENYSDEHTDGVVYFNPNIPTKVRADGMEFSGWYPFYRDDDVNECLSKFVNDLGREWLEFCAKMEGHSNPVLKFDSFETMSALLQGPDY